MHALLAATGETTVLHSVLLLKHASSHHTSPHLTSPHLFPNVQVTPSAEHPLLQPAAARLANAMVAVLGPRLRLGGQVYARCRALISPCAAAVDCAPHAVHGSSSVGGVPPAWAELEQVWLAGAHAVLLLTLVLKQICTYLLFKAAPLFHCPHYVCRCCLRSSWCCLHQVLSL
jgi:hypothetical protein